MSTVKSKQLTVNLNMAATTTTASTTTSKGIQQLSLPHVVRIAIKVAPFCHDDPALLFAHLECQLTLDGVTNDATKYNYVVTKTTIKSPKNISLINPYEEDLSKLPKLAIQEITSSSLRLMTQAVDIGRKLRHVNSEESNFITMEIVMLTQLDTLTEEIAAVNDKREHDPSSGRNKLLPDRKLKISTITKLLLAIWFPSFSPGHFAAATYMN
ncbi:hypothetical protein TcasGA2_TC016187 [Tribolium castaneum]|uniref:DUF7041 domain-containing protein n=1 Tax=Tribolium castaneum TaxID=7070 RepID=D7EIZ6_TRICA|nr:hypothetical protein TcasGA2_TC016187 [Tribolium castaneum]